MLLLRFLLVGLLCVSAITSFAQVSVVDSKNRVLTQQELQILEEILIDANNLKLPETRAVSYAQAGKYLWKADEKRARELFQQSIDELIKAQTEVKTEEEGNYKHLSYGNYPRWNIIDAVANRDAELAHKFLIKSRPEKLRLILPKFYKDENAAVEPSVGKFASMNETLKELRLEVLVAGQNPGRAVAFIREDLKEGISEETLDLLKALYKRNPKLANRLTEKAVEKLLTVELTEGAGNKLTKYKFQYNFQIASKFFFGLAKEPQSKLYPMTISDKLFRALVDKLTKVWLTNGGSSIYIDSPYFKIIEKLLPVRAEELKQKKNESKKEILNQEYGKYYQLRKNNLTAEELIKQAENFPTYNRFIYDEAACRLARSGNFQQAEALLLAKLNEDYSKRRMTQIYNSFAMRALLNDDFAEAEKLINKMPADEWRLDALLYLAKAIYLNNPEKNRQKALEILSQAKLLITNSPKSFNEVSRFSKVILGYAIVDPAQGFQMFESIISELNRQNYASVKNIRPGEIYSYTYNLEEAVHMFQKTDVQKTVQFINKFDRPETRIFLKLQLLENRRYNLKSLLFRFRTCQN